MALDPPTDMSSPILDLIYIFVEFMRHLKISLIMPRGGVGAICVCAEWPCCDKSILSMVIFVSNYDKKS